MGESVIEDVIEAMNEANKAERLVPLFLAPWLRHFIPKLIGWNDQQRCNVKLWKMAKEMIDKAKDNFVREGAPNDFVEAYLRKMYDEQKEGNNTFNEDELTAVIIDLFIAGSESTATTLYWFIR